MDLTVLAVFGPKMLEIAASTSSRLKAHREAITAHGMWLSAAAPITVHAMPKKPIRIRLLVFIV